MNIFASLQTYASKWNVKSTRSFDIEEINAVKQAEVVPSQFGNSVMFIMKAGGNTYIPLSNDSEASVGDIVDMTKAQLITLSKEGENDIVRVSI